ncbi:protein-disulfide isomerase [Kineococcus xinjiangensis]|uniref:Protein-disulfide isomerase n=1 Tax=Kineococcus xinjiangensis TaxID=512762 RepID=A0A2S6IP92_9ACTN|nr:thioredoxin domain-containing protein [Kineococcus xinjiangensis]PPK96072.1 protein-disulfide isomerase [Kineococcus xinjiangensis]
MSAQKRARPRSGNPATQAREAEARRAREERAAAQRVREAAAARRRRVGVVTGVVVAVLAVVAVVAVLVARSGGTADGPTPTAATGPAGGFPLPGTPDPGAPRLDVWLDYQCPFCARFDAAAGEELSRLAADGDAEVVVHTLSFLDDHLGGDSSSRAAQGAAAAAEQGRFAEYTREVFERQPEEEGAGYAGADLEAAARDAGVEDLGRWREAVRAGTYAGFVERVQEAMPADVTSTPTVQLTPPGGQPRTLDPEELRSGSVTTFLREQVSAAKEAAR